VSRHLLYAILLNLLVTLVFPAFARTALSNCHPASSRPSIPEHGLSQSIVEDIVQDHQGFLWFATEDGLNRFDGYTFRTWHHDPDDLNSLSYSHVQSLLVDADSTLWIGTFDAGLNHYCPLKCTFIHYRCNPNDSLSLSNEMINTLYQDSGGALWIGTDGGLNRLSPDRLRIEAFGHNPQDPLSLSDNSIQAICPDGNGNLWVGTANGVNRFDPRRGTASRFYFPADARDAAGANFVQTLCFDRQGALWIGTRNGFSACKIHSLNLAIC
jgi:ligand-binding sensor domain-containing protein